MGPNIELPIDQHFKVKVTGRPNFLEARIPVKLQLNVNEWERSFNDYWDKQLLQFVTFGFPLDFSRNTDLVCDMKNHSSATQFPEHVECYLAEEKQHPALLVHMNVLPFLDFIIHLL